MLKQLALQEGEAAREDSDTQAHAEMLLSTVPVAAFVARSESHLAQGKVQVVGRLRPAPQVTVFEGLTDGMGIHDAGIGRDGTGFQGPPLRYKKYRVGRILQASLQC